MPLQKTPGYEEYYKVDGENQKSLKVPQPHQLKQTHEERNHPDRIEKNRVFEILLEQFLPPFGIEKRYDFAPRDVTDLTVIVTSGATRQGENDRDRDRQVGGIEIGKDIIEAEDNIHRHDPLRQTEKSAKDQER